jgi:hypothetical protein
MSFGQFDPDEKDCSTCTKCFRYGRQGESCLEFGLLMLPLDIIYKTRCQGRGYILEK